MILKKHQERTLLRVRQFLNHLASGWENVLEMDPVQTGQSSCRP